MNKSVFSCAQLKVKRDIQQNTLSPSLDQDLQVRIQRLLFKAFLVCVCVCVFWSGLVFINFILAF